MERLARNFLQWLPLAAALVLLGATGGVARAQSSNSVSIGLANLIVQGELNQFRTNDSFQIVAAPAYIYSITGNVHGVGPIFSLLVPTSEPAATAFEAIDKGLSSALQGSVANSGGTLPATVLNQQVSSGTDGVFNANFGISIDASGLASFSLTGVAINEGGQPDTTDQLVFDSGSLTITALSADVGVSTLAAEGVTDGGAILHSSVICPNAFQAYFLYGTGTTLSGTSTMVSLASSGTAQIISIPLTGLLPHQLYHMRAVAADITGPSYGALGSFITLDDPPVSGTFTAFAGLTPLTIPVLSHCVDPDGNVLKVTAVVPGYGGRAVIAAGRKTITFQFTGAMLTDKLYYTVADDYGGSSTGLVNLVNYAGLAGSYSAVLVDGNSQQAGYLRVTLSATGICTGSVIIGGVAHAFTGVLNSSGQLVKNIASNSPNGISVTIDLVPNGPGYALDAAVAQNAVRLSAMLQQSAAGLATGSYTVALSPPMGSAWAGSGYAVINVGATGAATVTGALPDGVAFSCSTAVDALGQASVYSPLYASSNRGSLSGELALHGATVATAVTGTLQWTKPAQSTAWINQGPFSIALTGSGGPYVPLEPALQFGASGNIGQITLTGGNLNSPIREAFSISPANVVSILGAGGYGMSLSIQPASGLFSGKFIDPLTGQGRAIHGVLLQSSGAAAGYFLGDSIPGAAVLGP
ncbi:MAG TPA: hypothetical protein VHY22_00915 [Chthoniobacteraceae bacterium]|jgi:hypothetical protein|nr:hypothetical protein [Chthoniobacteraceae bacterium]